MKTEGGADGDDDMLEKLMKDFDTNDAYKGSSLFFVMFICTI